MKDEVIEKLLLTASDYRKRAYAPYSGFRVGAAVESASGRVYGGCNIENMSYGLTVCAERNAVFCAVSEGEDGIRRVAVVTSEIDLSVPCGACWQVLIEFGRDMQVLCCDTSGSFKELKLRDIPENFDKSGLFRGRLDKFDKNPD